MTMILIKLTRKNYLKSLMNALMESLLMKKKLTQLQNLEIRRRSRVSTY